MTEDKANSGSSKPKGISPSLVVLLLVLALFIGILLAKVLSGATTTPAPVASVVDGVTAAPAQADRATITSAHNDAVADYEAALRTGKPVYVLFHSLTCQPCVEISAVVDKVMPAYEGKVVFVNAISDDAPSQQLASHFQFQYIPTSFFIAPDGTVAGSFTGSMPEADMRSRLDKLTAR